MSEFDNRFLTEYTHTMKWQAKVLILFYVVVTVLTVVMTRNDENLAMHLMVHAAVGSPILWLAWRLR